MNKWFLGLVLILSCTEPLPNGNQSPTVVFTIKPSVITDVDSVRFEWQGNDFDGRIAGYFYGLDDTTPDIWTESTGVTLYNLSWGSHVFCLQAIDDSGARSIVALAPFHVAFPGAIPSLGDDTTLEIVTWNIQNFPKNGDSTLMFLRTIIPRMDLDLYCIQEIEDTIAFLNLLAGLPNYQGFYSRDNYGSFYQKTAVIYKSGIIEVSDVHQIFWENDSFPRPPLVMTVTASSNGATFDFRLIVLHLKAGSSVSDWARRAGACRLLKTYIDSQLARGGEQDFVVAGDWNDELDKPEPQNVFLPFLADTINYQFLTQPLAGNEFYGSLVTSGVLFDHILVTSDVLTEYTGGRTTTLRLDDELVGYLRLISDHRPVMATFPVFK
jgi:endonuclease/exonuclease/phosphatase family metal-dependent hydrolase